MPMYQARGPFASSEVDRFAGLAAEDFDRRWCPQLWRPTVSDRLGNLIEELKSSRVDAGLLDPSAQERRRHRRRQVLPVQTMRISMRRMSKGAQRPVGEDVLPIVLRSHCR